MTDTTLLTTSIPYSSNYAGGYGYGNQTDCLGDVILANQISSTGSNLANEIHSSSVTGLNATHNGTMRVTEGLCENRAVTLKEGSDTREVVYREVQEIKLQLCNNFADLKAGQQRVENTVIQENSRNREEILRSQLESANRELLQLRLGSNSST